jgi:hypothetical protein
MFFGVNFCWSSGMWLRNSSHRSKKFKPHNQEIQATTPRNSNHCIKQFEPLRQEIQAIGTRKSNHKAKKVNHLNQTFRKGVCKPAQELNNNAHNKTTNSKATNDQGASM